MNANSVDRLLTAPLAGTWYRALRPERIPELLDAPRALTVPSRFNEGDGMVELLYFGDSRDVVLAEHDAVAGSARGGWRSLPGHTSTIVTVDVRLSVVADLTSVDQQRRVLTNAQELTGDWRGYRIRGLHVPIPEPRDVPAPTQELGRALFSEPRIEAFLTLSARLATHRLLVVFLRKLRVTSSLSYLDPQTGERRSLPAHQNATKLR